MKNLLLTFIISIFSLSSFAQIFSQNFSSTNLADYISATPNSGQFNSIGSSGNGTLVSINSGALRFDRTASANAGSFSRTTDFAGPPTFLSIKLRLTISGTTASQTTGATFQVGSGFGTANSTEANSSVHSRFGINLSATSGNFSLRNIGGSANSIEFTGAQELTFFINNTGSTKSYTAPDGSNEGIADDTWDLWVGTTRIFNDVAATSGTVNIADIKFVYSAGAAIIDIDDILINDQTTALPVALLPLTAKASGKNINLAWKTASETNNLHFDILRSGNADNFAKIGNIKGAGTIQTEQSYAFIDVNPFPGINYYKLRQVDLNGAETLSDPVSAKSNVPANNFKIMASDDRSTIDLTVFAANVGTGSISIYDLSGRKLKSQTLQLSKGYNSFSLPSGTTGQGLHIATLTVGTETITNKFVR